MRRCYRDIATLAAQHPTLGSGRRLERFPARGATGRCISHGQTSEGDVSLREEFTARHGRSSG